MSFLAPFSSLLDDAVAVILRGRGSVAGIIPDVIVEEQYEDKLSITMHPVEQGANVSDHAFVMPRVVEMRMGWSDGKAGWVGAHREAYEALIALQAAREPFSVSTGKRLYTNMLVAGISVTNDAKTKHALIASVRLQEVRIASTTLLNTAAMSDMRIPEKTAGSTDIGEIQTMPAGLPWDPLAGLITLSSRTIFTSLVSLSSSVTSGTSIGELSVSGAQGAPSFVLVNNGGLPIVLDGATVKTTGPLVAGQYTIVISAAGVTPAPANLAVPINVGEVVIPPEPEPGGGGEPGSLDYTIEGQPLL